MPLYTFKCKVCENLKEFNMRMSDVPRVGFSVELTPLLTDSEELVCKCGTNNWTRTWPKSTGGFRFNMRRTGLL